MIPPLKTLLAAFIAFSAASPALAFGCYERAYTNQHLAGHPRQVVRSIILNSNTGEAPAQLEPGEFEIKLVVQDRLTSLWHSRSGVCAAREARINCGLESDGGTFTISQGSGRSVVLRTEGDLRVGEEDSLFEFGGGRSDDNAFVMQPAACRRDG